WITSTRRKPRESATETYGRWRGHTCAAYRQRGKGAVRAHRRRGDTPARQTPPGARPSRTVDPARRGPGRSQGASAPRRGFGPDEIDVRSRQDPAYRLPVRR